MILRGATSLLGALEGVGSGNKKIETAPLKIIMYRAIKTTGTLIVIESAAILGGKEVNKIQPYIIFEILTKILCKMTKGNEKRIKVLLPVGGRKALTTLRARMNCDHRHRIPLLHLSTGFLHQLLGPLFFHRSKRFHRSAGIIRSHHR